MPKFWDLIWIKFLGTWKSTLAATGRTPAQKVYGLAKNQGLLQNSLVGYDVVHYNVADTLAV